MGAMVNTSAHFADGYSFGPWVNIGGKMVKKVTQPGDSSRSGGGTSVYYDGNRWYSMKNGVQNPTLTVSPTAPSFANEALKVWNSSSSGGASSGSTQNPMDMVYGINFPVNSPTATTGSPYVAGINFPVNYPGGSNPLPSGGSSVSGSTGDMQNWLSNIFSQLLSQSSNKAQEDTQKASQAKEAILNGAQEQAKAITENQNQLAGSLVGNQGNVDSSINAGLGNMGNAATSYQNLMNPLLGLFSSMAQGVEGKQENIVNQYNNTQSGLSQLLANSSKFSLDQLVKNVTEYGKNAAQDQNKLDAMGQAANIKREDANYDYQQGVGKLAQGQGIAQSNTHGELGAIASDFSNRIDSSLMGLAGAYENALNGYKGTAQNYSKMAGQSQNQLDNAANSMANMYGSAANTYGQLAGGLSNQIKQGANNAAQSTLSGANAYTNLMNSALQTQQDAAQKMDMSKYMNAINGGGVDPQTDAMLKSIRDSQMESVQNQVQAGVNQTMNRVKQTMGNRGMMDSSYMADAVSNVAGQQANILNQASSALNSQYAQNRLDYPFKQQQAALSGIQALAPQLQMANTMMQGAGDLGQFLTTAGEQGYRGAVDSSTLQNQVAGNMGQMFQQYGNALFNPSLQVANFGMQNQGNAAQLQNLYNQSVQQSGDSLANYRTASSQSLAEMQKEASKFGWDSTMQGANAQNQWLQYLNQAQTAQANQAFQQAYQQAGYGRATGLDYASMANDFAKNVFSQNNSNAQFGRQTGLDLASLQNNSVQSSLDALGQLFGYGNSFGSNASALQSQLGKAMIDSALGNQSSDRADYQSIMNALYQQSNIPNNLYGMADKLPYWSFQNQQLFSNEMSNLFGRILNGDLQRQQLDIQDDANDTSFFDFL